MVCRARRSSRISTARSDPAPYVQRPPTGIRSGASVRSGWNSVQVVAQHLRAAGVAQLRHGLRLDLADPLTGDPVDLADLVEGAGLPVGQTEPQPDDAGLALRQRLQHAGQLVLHEREAHRVDRDDRLGVLDEVTELAVALVADGLVEADRLP